MKKFPWLATPLVLLLPACGSGVDPASEPTPEVSVGASSFAGFAAVLSLAENEDAPVDVEVVEFGSSAERGVALVNGDIDMALLGWTQVVQLTEREGADVVVIASNFERGRTVIAREGSGITNIEDLQGRTVAYSTGSMVDLDINSQLESAGLSIGDIDAVNMSFTDMVIALANGDIDAYYGSEPQSSNTIASGSGYLVQYPYDDPHAVPYGAVNGALVTTKSYLEENREVALQFLSSYVTETESLNGDRERLSALISEMIGETDREVIDSTLDNLELTYSLDGYEERIEALSEAQLALDFITTSPSYEDFVDSSLLDEAAE